MATLLNAPTTASPIRLLDSDVVIDLKRGYPGALAWYSTLDLTAVGIPGVVAMEMVQSARNQREVVAADQLLFPFARLWPSAAACEAAYADFRKLHLSHGLGLVDALIGATAREWDAILCTFNVRHFSAMPSLTTEQPYLR